MKRNLLKRIGAVALALAVSMTMGVTAFAADLPDNTAGNFGDGSGESTGKAFTLNNETYASGSLDAATFKVHFDLVDTNAYRPQTQFSYSIAPGSAVAATTDKPAILAGVTDGVTLSTTVTDAWDTVNSTENTDDIALGFDATKFTKPGIYRYVLTEANLTSEQQAIDIADGDASNAHPENVLYLDVYVERDTSGFKVVAAVLLNQAESPTLSDQSGSVSGTKETATYTHKIDGFYNHYTSYTVTLQKTVDGSMGDQNKEFPFDLGLKYTEPSTDDTHTTILGQKVNAAATTNSSVGTSYAMGTTSGTAATYSDIKIKHAGKVTLSGLSKTAVIQLKETIDETEGYTITSTVTDMDESANVSGVTSDPTFVTTGKVNDKATQDITYTNFRGSISPTNVVIKFAPFLFIFGAAVLLLVVMRRRKAQDAE